MNATRTPVAISPLAMAIASILYGGATVVPVPAHADNAGMLEEVVVTARKRTESLQNIPASIDVYSKEALERLAISKVEDYAMRTPSISMISIGPGGQYLFMRGASDGSNPEVPANSIAGFFLNDVSLGYYGGIPDLHMYDLERIEVLNGPQGTLYGSGSMSGAIKLIPSKPDPTAFSAGVDVDVSRFAGGDSANHTEEGFINIPLFGGTTALRVSGFNEKQGGFIDNLLITRNWVNGVVSNNAQWAHKDYNTQTFKGGRVALLHNLNDSWKVTVSVDYQDQQHNGAWDHDPTRYGDLKVARFGPEWGDNYNTIAQAKIEGDVGIGDLTYVAGYYKSKLESVNEYSEYVQYVNTGGWTPDIIQGFACAGYGSVDCNNPYQYTDYRSDVKRATHELRLQSKGDGNLHWIVGGYLEQTKNTYSDFWHMPGIQHNGEQAAYYISSSGSDRIPDAEEWYASDSRYDEHQSAIFGEANYAINDKIRLTAGARWFEARSTGDGYGAYFYEPRENGPYSGKWSKTTFRAGIEYKPRESRLFYLSFAQGFREGVINTTGVSNNPAIQQATTPDTLNTFELGWKTEYQGGRYRWNGAAYYTDWKDFQTTVFDLAISPTSFYANMGDARIVGMETSIEARPTEGLSLSLSGSYNDSQIVTNTFANADFPVLAHERLPSVPYFKASATVRYEWPVFAGNRAYVQFDQSHTGSSQSSLNVNTRTLQPGYNLGSLRFGLDHSEGHWGVEGYVSNITNKHAVIFVNPYLYDSRITTNAPRAIGMRLKYRFGGSGN
jgi:outer membrane receptor protein involved in Fe transport